MCLCMCVWMRECACVRDRVRRGDRSGTKYVTFAIEYVYDCSMSMRTDRVHKNGGAIVVIANNR